MTGSCFPGKYGFGTLLLAGLFLLSCNKDPQPALQTRLIVIGDYNNMLVDSMVKIIDAPYNGYEDIILDLNRDDTSDLRLLVAMFGSPGMGIHSISQLQPLHTGISFFGVNVIDSTFLDEDHFMFSDEYNNYHTIVSNFSCRRKSPWDRFLESGTCFHPRELKKGEKLDQTAIFASDTTSFIYSWFFHGIQTFENDTVFLHTGYYEFDCYRLPYNKAIYLGVKIQDSIVRLGWIQLVLESENRIRLKEVAFQKR